MRRVDADVRNCLASPLSCELRLRLRRYREGERARPLLPPAPEYTRLVRRDRAPLSFERAEFEKEAGRKLTYGDPAAMAIAPDLDESTLDIFTSCELTQRLRFSDSAVDVLGKLPQGRTLKYDSEQELPPWAKVGAIDDPDPQISGQASIADPIRNGDLDGQMTLVDNWERPMRVVHPGRTWRTGDTETRDEDGTIRTPKELIYGICREKRVLIVSSGPDQVFGTLNGTEAQQAFAEDNIYSYEPYRP